MEKPLVDVSRMQSGSRTLRTRKAGKADPRGVIERMLASAGVRIDGDSPWDIRVHQPAMYDRLLAQGSVGLGESYMDGWWDCPALDEFFYRILNARLDRSAAEPDLRKALAYIRAVIVNAQSGKRAFEVGRRHYDIGNRLYSLMLDDRMIYSCGYWKDAHDLNAAQKAKLDLICRKLDLEPGMTVLDIGCGWGGFARYAATVYGARVTGVTISREQAEWAKRACQGCNVRILYRDYRDLNGTFDRVVSVGMFEHVGSKNYKKYMKTVRDCLRDDGLFLLQTIGGSRSVNHTDPWIEKYIFPNGMLPSPRQITAAAEGVLVLEDWHSFGQDYDKTLMAWHRRFTDGWDAIKDQYDQRFFRMWTYYLLSCAGSFRAGRNRLWQIVLSKNGVAGGYRAVA